MTAGFNIFSESAHDVVDTPCQQKPLRMHQDSSQVGGLFNPVRGIRDLQKRQGKTPVNHAKNNRRDVSEQSRLNARRKAEQVEDVGGQSVARHTKPSSARCKQQQHERNFVHENILEAGACDKRSAENNKDGSEYLAKANYGRVPTYLHERKMELAAKDALKQAQKEASLIPQGMRIMSDEERLETLTVLASNKTEVEEEMQRLPFVIETPSQVKHKNNLERRLQEIEEANKIFSRSKVLVKI